MHSENLDPMKAKTTSQKNKNGRLGLKDFVHDQYSTTPARFKQSSFLFSN